MNRPERRKKTTRHHKPLMMAMMPTIRVNLSVTCCAFHILLENELDNCVRMKPFLQPDSIINGPFQIQFVPFFSLRFLRRKKKVSWRSDKNKMLLAKDHKNPKKTKIVFRENSSWRRWKAEVIFTLFQEFHGFPVRGKIISRYFSMKIFCANKNVNWDLPAIMFSKACAKYPDEKCLWLENLAFWEKNLE